MSLLSSFTKNSRLQSAIKTVAEARKSEEVGKSDQLFLKAYQGFADVISGDLVLAQSLYNWGFALLQQARTKTGETAINLYEDAIAKFSFCATVDTSFLGAAIDGGVALMELARIKAVPINDGLYSSAKTYFERAEQIQKGSALYNLACIHALMGNEDACLSALSAAVNYGSLPSEEEILADPDLDKIKAKGWFLDFIESLRVTAEMSKPEHVDVQADADVPATEDAPKLVVPEPKVTPEIRSEHYKS